MKKLLIVSLIIVLPVSVALFYVSHGKRGQVQQLYEQTVENVSPSPAPTPPPLDAMKIYNLVNSQRAESTLPVLTWNDKLAEASTFKAQDMCNKQYWSHISPDGTTPWKWIKDEKFDYSTAGENLGRDFISEDSLVFAWMKSTEHRENILKTTYKETGVGVVRCMYFGFQSDVVVQLFATVAPKLSPIQVKAQAEKSWSDLPADSPVHCPIGPECGGGTTPLKKWECDKSTCCQMRDKSWKFYKNRDDCIQDQQKGL